jgi:hypothetical protein
MSRLRVIVTGLIAQHPHMGGVAWDYLQYALGLKQLGHDVYYFEDSGEWPYNLDGGETGNDWAATTPDWNLAHLSLIMERYGMGDRWAYRFPRDDTWYGLPDSKRREILATADLLINVSGTIERPERYRQIPRMAYIDSDPLFTQIKYLQQGSDFSPRVDVHDVYFTFGEALSHHVPETGHRWMPTRHPMVLDEWKGGVSHRGVYSTVMNWTSYKPIVHEGEAYGQKDVEFRKFLHLPDKVAIRLEVALANTNHVNWQTDTGGYPDDVKSMLEDNPEITPQELLRMTGFEVVDPDLHCAGLDEYRNYITSSKAEWSVAKNGYVGARTGWFSCRSCCYLAAGRPVVVQDTGFTDVIPTGEGVLVFSNLNEAIEGILSVENDYARHSRAAREIAAEYFDSQKVLASLVDRAMNGMSPVGGQDHVYEPSNSL